MIYLKQSTASQEVLLGPFVDSTDGVTAETGLTIANTDIKIFKAGATTLANKNSGGATHISAGNYYAVLDATDTGTVGSGAIVVQVAGALAVRHDFTVLPAVPYDALIGGTDTLTADVIALNGDATSAASIAKTTRAIGRGTVTTGASTTSIPTSAFSPSGAASDQFKGRVITFDADTTTTALRGQSTDITASSNAAAPTFTVSALTTAPASGDTFSVT